MVGSYQSEITCYVPIQTPFTRRWLSLVKLVPSDRFVFLKLIKYEFSHRRCFYDIGRHTSDRYVVTPEVSIVEGTSRFCVSGEGLYNDSQRYCTYVPGAQVLIYTIETHSSITYISEKQTFCCQTQISQRNTAICYTAPSEVACQVVRYQENRVHTIWTNSSISTYSERQILFEHYPFTQRITTLTYQAYSEKHTTYQTTNEGLIHTPQVQTTILDMYSERWCEVVQGYTLTERQCFFLTSPFCEMQICLRYKMSSERYVTCYIGRMWRLHDFIVTPSILKWSDRYGFVTPIAYLTERQMFAETRPLYLVKTPLGSSAAVTVRSNQDNYCNVKISNDRHLEYHGLQGDIQSLKAVQYEKIIMKTHSNELHITAVDNKGAAINTQGINKPKQLLCTVIARTQITFI